MKTTIKTLALITVTVAAVKAFERVKRQIETLTITNDDDEVLLHMFGNDMYFEDDIKVYWNDEKLI